MSVLFSVMGTKQADETKSIKPDVAETLPIRTEQEGETPSLPREYSAPPHRVRIGPYRVIRELGHGGMGAVYLAARADEQFEQNVALKVIKRGMDSEEIIRRFRRERQILAQLDHPNVAKLMDGGTTEDGLPYFVMEYIHGEPVQEYCERRNLGIQERLHLFRMVCSAVQYAHQNLVVHRDLKPGNILVTDAGQPKLLDFGLAKLLSPQAEAGVEPLTAIGARLMTPEYASPEQARGDPITTATDVYSLGVILYELLTKHRPFLFTSREPDAVVRVISDHEPQKPSTAITQEVDKDRHAASSAGWNRKKLSRSLRGDLDNIVMMALRKEPQRRYASVEAFSEDVRRYQEGMPVLARKPTASYRAGKFVRRNKTGVGIAAILIVSMLGFAVTMTVQSRRLARERDAVARERDRAEQVTTFLTSAFSISDPGEARGNEITAREILDRGSERIRAELKDQPEVRSALLDTMGRVYQSLGLYDKAGVLLKEALEIRRRIHGENHPDVAESLSSLAALRLDSGEYESAEKLYRQALDLRRKLFGNESLKVADSMNGIALVLHSKGDYSAAEPLYREVLQLERKLLGREHADVATALGNLALVLHDKGDLTSAEPLYRETLAMERKLLGDIHPNVARDMNNLASLLQDKADYGEAEILFRDVVALDRKLYGKEHPEIGTALNNLGLVLQDRGNYASAEPLFREALAMDRKLLGKEHPDVMRIENNLADLLYQTGHPEEAEPMLREVLTRDRELLGNEHPLVVSHLNNLASLLSDRGDFAQAEPMYREAVSAARKIYENDHETTARLLIHLGELLADRNQLDEAEPLIREGFEMARRTNGEKHPLFSECQSVLGKYLCLRKRYQEAEPLLIAGYHDLASSVGEANKSTRDARRRLAYCHKIQGKPDIQ